jgi:hypothetical protein
MYFAFDESGGFVIPSSWLNHRAAVIVCVVVPESIEPALDHEFQEFIATLDASEFERGEPKGRLLSASHRLDLCNRLGRHPGILIIPVTLDLSSLTRHRDVRERMGSLLEEWAGLMSERSSQDELRLAARQFRNLSVDQALRLYTLANCIREALQHSILFRASGSYEHDWKTVQLDVDRVQRRAKAREEQVFGSIVYGWISGWTRRHPFDLAQGVHTGTNEFVKQYDTADGISLTRLLKGNIHWVDSSVNWKVQMADMAAAIVGEAVRDLHNDQGALTRFALLMRSSSYGWAKGSGLFAPVVEAMSLIESKYRPLAEALRDLRRPAAFAR